MPSPIDYERRGFLEEEEINDINKLMTSSTQLLTTLLEGNDDLEIKNQLCDNLDILFLKKKLVIEYTNYLQDTLHLKPNASKEKVLQAVLTQENFDDLEEAFNMYILLATLADYREGIYKDLFYSWQEKSNPDLAPEK